jgi:hypothetical protein
MAPSTPADWRNVLVDRLDKRWAQLRVFDAYYEGDQVLAFVTRKFRDAYGNYFKQLTDNYMPLVVDSAAERMRVNGFRFGDQEDADTDAWDIWQDNGLDGASNMVHTEAIKTGWAYWLVQPNGDTPRITAEHPSQVIVATAPGDRTERLAAVKKWADEDGFIYANVYLPDRVVKYRTTSRQLQIQIGDRRWETTGAVGNPLGVVPVIPVPNNPSMLHGGRSDLNGGPCRVQDGINKLLCDLFIGSEYQAYPQRVLLGVEPPRDSDGNPIPNADLKASQSRLWFFNSPDAKAFEFSSADLGNFRDSMDGMIGDLAAQTRIPIYYFRPQAISNLSAEALIGLDAGLVSKTNDKRDPFGEAHEEMMRLAFKAKDPSDERANETGAETIWRNTESRSFAQLVDGVVKMSTVGVPQEILWEKLGFTPQEIDRMKAIQDQESLLQQIPPSRESLRLAEMVSPQGTPVPAGADAASAGPGASAGSVTVTQHTRAVPGAGQ